jgi:N-carbamoyl-L-amino-acid hydrolase
VAPAIDAARVIADLRELDRRTGGPGGARRLCWGEEWRRARAFLAELLEEIGLGGECDEAGNFWAYLETGEDGGALALGSHLDSVPHGGWLDGALGVMAAVGVLRAWAESPSPPPRTLALVDWADEEGARFGRSLFGSSAVAGTLEPAELASAVDADGRPAAEVLAENDVDLEQAPEAVARRDRLGSYLELHIEQGPVMEAGGVQVAPVAGCVGIERTRFVFAGQASHAGTTPMAMRRDAALAAAATALEVETLAKEAEGVGTTGQLDLEPGIPTAVAGRAALTLDLRHGEELMLAAMLGRAREAAAEAAEAHRCKLAEEPIWRIEPVDFDKRLVVLAGEECGEEPLRSGALHDAAEMAGVLPAAMLFVPSIDGLSHAPGEDTSEEDLTAGIETFGRLVERALSE